MSLEGALRRRSPGGPHRPVLPRRAPRLRDRRCLRGGCAVRVVSRAVPAVPPWRTLVHVPWPQGASRLRGGAEPRDGLRPPQSLAELPHGVRRPCRGVLPPCPTSPRHEEHRVPLSGSGEARGGARKAHRIGSVAPVRERVRRVCLAPPPSGTG